MKLVNIEKTPYLRLLVYGDSGSGKTTLMGTAMECKETFPLLVMNARGQPVSLRWLDPPPLVLTIENMKDFNLLYQYFLNDQDLDLLRGASTLQYGILSRYLDVVKADRFGCVGIDSVTHVQRIALNGVVGKTSLPGDVPPQTQIQQWGRVLAQMTNLADLFYQLPISVVMTALTRRDSIDAMGLILFAPYLWGQSQLEVPSHAEIVGRLMCTSTVPARQQKAVEKMAEKARVEVPYNILYLAGGRDFIAKWQGVADPPNLIGAPTIGQLMEVIKKG